MRTESTSPYPPLEPRHGVLVVDGYGIWIGVRNRHLVISDGFGRHRREATFARATSGIKRLILLGHTGAVSLQAIRWMKDVGIGFIHIDSDGTLLTTSAALGNDDARLRRAQALAHETGEAHRIACWILGEKLKGQERILATENPRLPARISGRSEEKSLLCRDDVLGQVHRPWTQEAPSW
jgi:hypothetical protein